MSLTTDTLPPLNFKVPKTLHEVVMQGPSAVGFSAVSGFLTCPEYARLRASGLRPKSSSKDFGGPPSLDALMFGSVAHAFAAIRVVYGEANAHDWLLGLKMNGEIDDADHLKLSLLFRLYDNLYPLANDPFEYLGVETEVRTDIKDRAGQMLIRTVRYDAVIRYPNGDLYSFERKTAAKSGGLQAYWPQAMVQTMLWNDNSALVAQYGKMSGVIFDHMVKTEMPKVERVGPIHFSKRQVMLAREYMRSPERTGFEVNEDGTHPHFLHSCYGRWRPCTYLNFCHDDARGDYQIGHGDEDAE